jgi:hypothetical protein
MREAINQHYSLTITTELEKWQNIMKVFTTWQNDYKTANKNTQS